MIIRKDIDLKQALTSEQKKMLEELKSRDVHPDENAPELTQEQLQQLARASQLRREERRKQSAFPPGPKYGKIIRQRLHFRIKQNPGECSQRY